MSDFRFGDDYRLNIDWEHQAPDFCFGWDDIDWDHVEWVEIDSVKYIKETTCHFELLNDDGDYRCDHCGYKANYYEFLPDLGEHCKGCGARRVD